MDWMDEVAEKMRRRNQILFSRDSAVLQPLSASLANVQRRGPCSGRSTSRKK